MGFFTTYSWRKSITLLLVAAILTGLAFAVRYGEDNQVGSSNEMSWWVFVFAGIFAYWALLGFSVLIFRSMSRCGKGPRAADDDRGK